MSFYTICQGRDTQPMEKEWFLNSNISYCVALILHINYGDVVTNRAER